MRDCWSIEPVPDGSGRWTYSYEFAPAPPAPLATIAWRLALLRDLNLRRDQLGSSAQDRVAPGR